jgi:hypothetical protein
MKSFLKYIFLILTIFVTACEEQSPKFKINYYKEGKIYEVIINKDYSPNVYNKIIQLLKETNDVLRLIVEEETIKNIKEKEEVVEIIFDELQLFDSKILGKNETKKILLPLSGEFTGNIEKPIVTLFLGDEEYFSGPLINTTGFIDLLELKGFIENQINKN